MRIIVIAAAVSLAGVLCVKADKVSFNDLPDPVKETIKAQRGTAAVKDIERVNKDGRTFYEVEFSQPGTNPKLRIGSDGTLMPETKPSLGERADRALNRFKRTPSMKLADVPEPVRKTIEMEAKGREVADIDRETWKGRTVYEVEFAQTGRNAQIHVAEDGTIVKDDRAGKGLKGLFMGTQLEDTPPAVQATIKREAGTREIADIDKETRAGRTIYEVEFKQPGRNIELDIAEDGSIVRDSRNVGTAPGEVEKDAGRASNKQVTFNELPPAVQQAIKGAGDPATLKPIHKKVKDGKTVYDVELQKEGRNTRLEIAEDGTVLKDNRR
jgi:uncharacterized membrane protein YkoI